MSGDSHLLGESRSHLTAPPTEDPDTTIALVFRATADYFADEAQALAGALEQSSPSDIPISPAQAIRYFALKLREFGQDASHVGLGVLYRKLPYLVLIA